MRKNFKYNQLTLHKIIGSAIIFSILFFSPLTNLASDSVFAQDICPPQYDGQCFGGGLCINGIVADSAECASQNNPPGQESSGTTINLRDPAAETLPGIPESYDPDNASAAFGSWIANLLNISLTIAVLLVLLYLLWGAFEWITSGGDSGKLQNARNRITQAVIGLIVLAATVSILVLVQRLLNICVLEFGSSCTAPTPAQPTPQRPIPDPAWNENVGFCSGGGQCTGLSYGSCQTTSGCVWTQAE